MMSTKSTLPMLSLLLIVLLLNTPRSAAQHAGYPSGQFNPPPPPQSPPPPPPRNSTQETSGSDPPAAQPKSLVWDASRYPATVFRSEGTPPMFALWPENLSYVKFEYYCEDKSNLPHNHSLDEFVYKEGEGNLVTRPYFDVGLVDEHFTPYFQHWQFWQVDIKRISCPLRCEYSDLQRLYAYRLKRNVLARGLGYGVAALTILQVAVIAFTALLRKCTHSTQQQNPRASASTFWSKICHSLHTWKSETPWIDCFCDWIHLLLLVVIGFAMMEGVGHSDFFRWRSMLLFNIAATYTYLTLFSMISSFLHQCAHFLTRRSFNVPALPMSTTPTAAGAARGLSEDWRYQRIFGQFGVLVLMGMYLIGVDDDEGQGMDSLVGIVVAAIVVACIWSAGVSGVVAVRSVRDMGRCLPLNAWKLRAISGSGIHELPASPQPTSNVSAATPVPEFSRSKTI